MEEWEGWNWFYLQIERHKVKGTDVWNSIISPYYDTDFIMLMWDLILSEGFSFVIYYETGPKNPRVVRLSSQVLARVLVEWKVLKIENSCLKST